MELPYNPAIPLLCIYPKEYGPGPQTQICIPMFIEALFTIGVTQVSIRGWMGEQNVVYTYNGTLFSLTKEGNSVIYYKVYAPWRHYTKLNKPVRARLILCNSTYKRYPE